jgi:sortase A
MNSVLRIIGIGLMAVALVMGVGIVRDLWFDQSGSEAAEQEIADLEQDWSRTGPSDHQAKPEPEYKRPIRHQEAFAIMRIPRLGAEWEAPVVKGTGGPALALGVGWFPASVLPGQVGNFAVAGHRCCASTHGEPFAYLDRIQDGDKVFVETRTHVYTYEMKDWYLTTPTDVEVVAPVPNKPEATPHKARITLVTCNPRWGSTERLITHGVLVRSVSK